MNFILNIENGCVNLIVIASSIGIEILFFSTIVLLYSDTNRSIQLYT